MEKQLEQLAKKVGKQIRAYLISVNLFEESIDIDFKIGKYSVQYVRNNSTLRKLEPLVDLPIEFFDILRTCLLEIEILYKEYEESGIYGEDNTSEYSIECIVDDVDDFSGTIEEIKARIQLLSSSITKYVQEENYEEASRLNKIVKNLQSKITNK